MPRTLCMPRRSAGPPPMVSSHASLAKYNKRFDTARKSRGEQEKSRDKRGGMERECCTEKSVRLRFNPEANGLGLREILTPTHICTVVRLRTPSTLSTDSCYAVRTRPRSSLFLFDPLASHFQRYGRVSRVWKLGRRCKQPLVYITGIPTSNPILQQSDSERDEKQCRSKRRQSRVRQGGQKEE